MEFRRRLVYCITLIQGFSIGVQWLFKINQGATSARFVKGN